MKRANKKRLDKEAAEDEEEEDGSNGPLTPRKKEIVSIWHLLALSGTDWHSWTVNRVALSFLATRLRMWQRLLFRGPMYTGLR